MTSAAAPASPRSEELRAPVGRDIELCYQTFGEPDADPLLLVMGLGGPMTWWPEALCEQLAAAGFFVVRFDNRDVGRSSPAKGRVRRSALVRAFLGLGGTPPYTVSDMAEDAVALLDHLGLSAVTVAGVSMGGMIAQTIAVEHPSRVRALVSIMSTTGRRTVGWQHPRLLPMLLARVGGGREAYVASSARMWRLIGSPGYPIPEEDTRARAEETFDRGVSLAGTMRQMTAIVSQPDREPALRRLRTPTLVVHGLADVMVHPSGGRATAASVPGSELMLVQGMGHDLPEPLFATLVRGIRRTTDRARVGGDSGR